MAAAMPDFVARTAELALLQECWAEAVAGRPVTVAIGAEAGVGKTRLVGELLARAAAEGATTLQGGCLDVADGGPPLWPFVEALRGYRGELDAEVLGPAGPELSRILPELREASGQDAPPPGASAQGRLFEHLLGLLGRLATRAPLVLVVEDLHWADRSTRDLIGFLARSLRAEPIMLVVTYRSDELYRGHPLRAFLAELYRARAVRRLDLHPFTRDELAEHLAGMLGGPPEPAVLESVFARSEGNAFFAEELVAAAREQEGADLPDTLRDILLTRVERRSAPTQEVLRVAAVGGRRVSVGLLEAVCGVGGRERSDALREAVAHHLLVPEGDEGLAFRHALLREAVYEELLPGERRELHVAYGTALSEQPELAGDEAVVAGELAYHWSAAHDVPRALAASVEAGRVAQSRWGFAEARDHFERALGLWEGVPDAAQRTGTDRLTLARQAAEAANLAGDHTRAAALMRDAIAHVEPADAGLLWERLGRYLWAAGASDAAQDAYEQALALVPVDPPSAARARVLAARGQSQMLLARFEEACACCEQAIAIARTVGARGEEGHALNTLGCARGFLGDPDAAIAHLREALAIADEVGDLDDLGRAYQNLSELLAGPLNRLEEARELALEGRARTEQLGLARDYGVSLEVNASTALLGLGRWEEADEILRAAQDRDPQEMAAIELHLCRGRLEVARGAFERAGRHLDAAQHLMAGAVDPQFRSVICAGRAELALWQGRPQEARDAVVAGLESLEDSDDAWFIGPLLWLGGWAEADLRAGDVGALVARAHALRTETERFVSPVTIAYARLAEAEAARLADAAADEPWRDAAAAWEAAGHPYPLAYARWREAEALLVRRKGREGAVTLREAHAAARRLGAGALEREVELLARRARVELEESAREPAPEAVAEPDALGLTPRELQVLALVAAGHTNREIARDLFVTEKTAGAHVSNILGKLGVRSRVEAATAAHRLGLLPAP